MPVAPTAEMSLEEFLALPENDGLERELIRGELRERTMTKRNVWHSSTESKIAFLLQMWQQTQPEPRGIVASGEAGIILRRDPPTSVGADVAYFTPEQHPQPESVWFEGPPVLAVEILSPSDIHEEVSEKIDEYLDAGVKLVWIVDPHFQTVTVHRKDAAPRMFNAEEQLTCEPFLPGFRAPVAALFLSSVVRG